jgi:very-short-patch-repair endonuclease
MPLAAETCALLGAPAGAVLSHSSAAALWGLLPGTDGLLHVTVPRGRGARRRGLAIHRSRTLTERDVRVLERLPVTSAARTLLDLAETEAERRLQRALDEALVARLASEATVREMLGRAAGRRGASRLAALLGDPASPALTRSEAEERFLALVAEAGLPRPHVNARACGYEVDFLWPEHRVVVEIDGYRFHGTRAAFERDRRKSAELSAAGLQAIRATWLQIDRHPTALMVSVAQTLLRGERDRGTGHP